MSASEIKAGSAYVEIGARVQPLLDGMRGALDAVKNFGMQTSGIGAIASAISLGPAIKSFADYGETIGKLQSKTGMSTEMIGGLQYAAEAAGINAGAVSGAIRTMQRNVGGSSKEVGAALKSIGLSAGELRGMSSEDQFRAMVDGLASISDPGERAAKGMQLLGRAYYELQPILEAGSAEMDRAAREVKQLHGVLGTEATNNAKKLDDSFDRLTKGVKGLRLEIGSALYPIVKPVVDRFIDLTVAASDWVEQNPNVVQTFVKTAASIAAVGVGIAIVSFAFAALTSPIVMVATGIGLIVAACLAVTDTLGFTESGFGDLFDSIRIGGTGLATHITIILERVVGGFNLLAGLAGMAWQNTKAGFFLMVEGIQAGVYMLWFGIFKMMDSGIKRMVDGLNTLLTAYNVVASKVGGSQVGMLNAPNFLGKMSESATSLKNEHIDAASKIAVDNGEALRKQWDDVLWGIKESIAKEDLRTWIDHAKHKDSPQNGIDWAKAGAAALKIGDWGFDKIFGPLGELLNGIKHQTFEDAAKKPEGPQRDEAGRPKFGNVGTFNSYAGPGLSATGVFDMQLRESKRTNEYLSQIASNTASGGAGAGFAG